MKYSGNSTTSSSQTETSQASVNSAPRVRTSLYNLLTTSSADEMPKDVQTYARSVNGLQNFWTEADIARFSSVYMLNDNQIQNLISENPTQLMSYLNTWIGNDSVKRNSRGSSGLCRIIEDNSEKFRDIIGKANIAVGQYQKTLGAIQSISASPVEAAKSMVDGIVDSYVAELKTKISNVNNLIRTIVQTKAPNAMPVISKVIKIRDELDTMTDDVSVSMIKEKIQSQLAITLSQFKEIRAEEIQHILDRVCSITQTVAMPFERKSSQMDSISNYYTSGGGSIRRTNNQATQNALNAGAYRYSGGALDSNIETAMQYEKRAVEAKPGGTYVEPPSQEEIEGVTLWNNGNGDSKLGFSGDWVSIVGSEGWTRVDPRVRVRLMRLQAMFGRKLTLNSGYRPEWYNKTIKGAAPNSLHIKGHAADITWAGFNAASKAEFINMARACGFTGIGVNYPTFVHVDIGRKKDF